MNASSPAPPVSEDAPALYRLLAQEADAGRTLTTLHIGGAHSTLASGAAGSAPLLLHTLSLGARAAAATRFARDLPSADELRSTAQDALAAFAPLRPRLAPGSQLHTADAGIRRMALVAGLAAQPEMELPRVRVDALLARLLGQAQGEDGSGAGGDLDGEGDAADAPPLPQEGRFAAAVVILHACLHGLDFDRILIRSDALA